MSFRFDKKLLNSWLKSLDASVHCISHGADTPNQTQKSCDVGNKTELHNAEEVDHSNGSYFDALSESNDTSRSSDELQLPSVNYEETLKYLSLYAGSDDGSTDSFNTAATSIHMKSAPLLPHVVESINEKLKRIIFIQQTDQKYHNALSDIRDQNTISLLVEPSFYGRHQDTSVVIIGTANNTYIFDIKALGAIFPELRKLLETECPRKIVHYSHRICDHLYYRHKIKLNGVCDTFVALCMARQQTSPCTLPEAIAMAFELSLSELLCAELVGPSESRRLFRARPITKSQLNFLAKMAIYQQLLHDRLLYDIICHKMQIMCSAFSDIFQSNTNGSEVALSMGQWSNDGFDYIDPHYRVEAAKFQLPPAQEIDAHELKFYRNI